MRCRLPVVLAFIGIALAHFALSVAGLMLVLPAAFETQGGQFWQAPAKVALVSIAGVLLAPLSWARPGFGFLDVAVHSALWGALAAGLYALWRGRARADERA